MFVSFKTCLVYRSTISMQRISMVLSQKLSILLFYIYGLNINRQDSFSPLTLRRTFDSKLFVSHIFEIQAKQQPSFFFLPPLLNVFFKSYSYIMVSFLFMCVLIRLLTCKVLYMSLLKLLTR